MRQIVRDMSAERKFKPRYTLADLDDLVAIEQGPLAAARIVVREITRIESKSPPSPTDLDKLDKALTLLPKIKRALRGGDLRKTPALSDAAKKDETAGQAMTVLDRIAEAERELESGRDGGETLSAAHAPPKHPEQDAGARAKSNARARRDMDAFIDQLRKWQAAEAAKRDDQPR